MNTFYNPYNEDNQLTHSGLYKNDYRFADGISQ